MNRSRVTGDLASHGNIFVDIANDRVGIGSTIPAHKLSLPDNARISLGDSADFQIYHMTHVNSSVISKSSSGTLFLDTLNDLSIRKSSTGAVKAKFISDGAVELYHSGSKKIETTANGVKLPDSARIDFGDSLDLKIYHHGDNSYIDTDTGDLILRSDADDVKILAEDDIVLRDNDDSTNFIHCINGGAVELYHNGTKRLETTSYGSLVTGRLNTTGNISMPDNAQIHLGDSIDLAIYHDGSHSYIDDTGTGNLKVRSNNFRVSNADESKISATFVPSGAVELYHNHSKKLETSSSGATVTGTLTATAFSGDGSNITAVNATTLDSIDSGSFLRSDAADSFNSKLTYSGSAGSTPIDLAAADGYASFRVMRNNNSSGSVADGMYIGYANNNSGRTRIYGGGATSGGLDVRGSGVNDVKIAGNTVWHAGNDGSGSGLDADTLDGLGSAGFLRSDAADSASGSISFTNTYYEFGNSTGSVSNDGGWHARVNLAGTQHARLDLKSVSDGIITTMYSHTGQAAGKVGTFSDHKLQFMINGTTRATLSTSGSLDTTVQGTLWGASNDGSGSGLDADTLDGIQGSSYVRTILDDHDITARMNSGFYETNTATTAEGWPETTNSDFHLIAATHQNTSNYFSMQIAGSMHNQDKFYIRSTVNSGTRAWSKIWTSSSDGSGSGLDADTLDGYQAVDLPFLRSDTTDAQTSGSMTFGRGGVDPDSFSASSGGFGGIGDGSGWGATGVFVHGGGTGDAAAMAHNGSALFFGIQDGANTNSMETWLQVTPGTRVINFSTDNTSNGVRIGGNTVWHAGNDGSGSTLDADLLDGSEKSAFVLNNQNSGYVLKFGSGSNSGNTSSSFAYAIFQEGGAWTSPFPDLRINYHTGIVLAANASYGGIRFQRDYNNTLQLMSVGDGDNNVRITYDIRGTVNHQTNIGTSSVRMGTIYANNISLSGTNAIERAETLRYRDLRNVAPADESANMLRFYFTSWGNSGNSSGYADGLHMRSYGDSSGGSDNLVVWYKNGFGMRQFQQSFGSSTDYTSYAQYFHGQSHAIPQQDNTFDLGSTTYRWRNIYSEELNVTKASGNLSGTFVASNGLGTLEIGGSTGAFIDLKMPSSDDLDFRIGTSGSGGYLTVLSGQSISVQGHFNPSANNTYDLGTTSARWRNLYTNDLNLSNEGDTNDVDGTWGSYTIQEGENDLFLINKRNGKKYKFNLTEVS